MNNINNPQQSSDNRKTIYALLIGALILTWGYIIYDKSKTKETITQKDAQIVTVTGAKDSLQVLFNDASARIDSITGNNVQLQGDLAAKNSEILTLKSNIRGILNKKNASDAELKQAKSLITELNGKIDDLYAQINQLKGENQQLSSANQQLSTEKSQLTSEKKNLETNLASTQTENKNLADKVDVASTLKATNIGVSAMSVKSSGSEKETSKAKKADLLNISCTLDENRVTPSGKKTLYVCVFNPDGTPSGTEGTFTTREGEVKSYTNKVDVNYEQGKSSVVNFSWKPNGKFITGDYKIEIYNNGFKIGEGRKTLKKSGFLGL
jgi:predicted nuclease with TOPRIM domain